MSIRHGITLIILLSTVILGIADYSPKTYWFPDGNGSIVATILEPKINFKSMFIEETQEKEKHVHFLLYSRENKNPTELTIENPESLLNSNFDRNLPTKFIIHGFTNSDSTGFPPAAKQVYLDSSKSPPVNLIVVDWGKLAQAPWYSEAAKNTQLVGVRVARFIEFLVAQGVSLDSIHLIGHSLGSHVAGFAGSNLNNMILPRITALDPALPHFEDASDENRIDPSDAAFVDVIHTAGGTTHDPQSTRKSYLAFIEPRGHADFYVNGGRVQPGCGVDFFGACSHLRAYDYFLESVTNLGGFPSCECASWEEYQVGRCKCSNDAFLGENSSSNSRGLFYLRTKPFKPYAMNAS